MATYLYHGQHPANTLFGGFLRPGDVFESADQVNHPEVTQLDGSDEAKAAEEAVRLAAEQEAAQAAQTDEVASGSEDPEE